MCSTTQRQKRLLLMVWAMWIPYELIAQGENLFN